jgi:outer membrane protein OmpA-like peptidoglycan-associated protein
MRTRSIRLNILCAALLSAHFAVPALAADGKFYDPSNEASPTGKTIGYELNRTIGCPGRGLMDRACPIGDSDGDGVTDDKDKCPDTPKGRKVNADGCELDSDGDGVVDGVDKCPDTPPGRTVNADGCEIDTDGDGLVDGDDKCPTVYAKTPDGCPLPVAATPAPAPAAAPVYGKLVLEGVNFDYDRASLRNDELPTLNEAAATLKSWGDTKVEVDGYTDSRGSDAYNMKLSLRRAESVRDYLIGKGIAADRLSVKANGESNPVADNSTPQGRFKNRRVELLPLK